MLSAWRKLLLSSPTQSCHVRLAVRSATGPKVQSEMTAELPTAPLSGLSPCVTKCFLGIPNKLLAPLDLTRSHVGLLCPVAMSSDRKQGAEGKASRTPRLAEDLSNTGPGARAPVLRAAGMEGCERTGFRTQRQVKAEWELPAEGLWLT